jgi:hypothetical protein
MSLSPALRGFVAGALAVPAGHQVALALFWWLGWTARAPFSLSPTEPLGVPALLSSMFWGGLWGIVLAVLLARRATAGGYWALALVFGALAPTLVAGLVVAPLRGQPAAAGGDPRGIVVGLAINAAWGLGVALLLRISRPRAQG